LTAAVVAEIHILDHPIIGYLGVRPTPTHVHMPMGSGSATWNLSTWTKKMPNPLGGNPRPARGLLVPFGPLPPRVPATTAMRVSFSPRGSDKEFRLQTRRSQTPPA